MTHPPIHDQRDPRVNLRVSGTRLATWTRTLLLLAAAGGAAWGLGGCAGSVQHVAAYHPVLNVTVTPPDLAALPLDPARDNLPALGAMTRPEDGYRWLEQQVEEVFQTGQVAYKAGHLSSARRDFDRALELLLVSGFDVQDEPSLASLFNRIVDTVHGEEMIAFREGDGFSEQKSAPAPMDEIAGLTFSPNAPGSAADTQLRGRAEGELQHVPHDLPLTVNDVVLSFLNFFQTPRGRTIVENGLRRSGRYRSMIERVLREEGLPADLIYLAQAESAFQPQALSRAGARGLWQFMYTRGKEYGLKHTWWVDDRQDPEKATRAAAEHLRDLYQMFGDWYLAMAAYDSGPGAVEHAVERTGYADFWQLYQRNALPQETRNYVPIIIALALIGKDPAAYGFDVQPDKPLRTDNVRLGHPVDLRLVAETIGVDLDTLRLLNPQLLRLVTPADPAFVLHLPEGTAERFYAQIAAIPPQKWVSWRRQRVEKGDTLWKVARRYHVRANAIAEANGIDLHAPLHLGEELVIPAGAWSQPSRGELVHYRVRRGDTLASIAERYDVSVGDLKGWNHLRSSRIRLGARLRVYPGGKGKGVPPFPTPASANADSVAAGEDAAARSTDGGEVVTHRVHQGETLWSIARAYRTTVEALRTGNSYLFSRPLQAGDTVTILPPQ
jgi:peptidoglycan lytic transglycosylase D